MKVGDLGGVPYCETGGEYWEAVGEYRKATGRGDEKDDVEAGYGVGGQRIGDGDSLAVVGVKCTRRCL